MNNWTFPRNELEQNLPSLHFDSLKQTQFIKKNAKPFTLSEEYAERKSSVIFMQELGQALKFPQITIATAFMYFHRFYLTECFQSYDSFDISITCLFLAGKVEETPKKLKEILITCQKIRPSDKTNFSEESPELKKYSEKVLFLERTLLASIAFDLSIEHPYKFVIPQSRLISGTFRKHGNKRSVSQTFDLLLDSKLLAQASWFFVTEGYKSTICLVFDPVVISWGAVYYASSVLGIDFVSKIKGNSAERLIRQRWEEIKMVSSEISELFDEKPTAKSITEKFSQK